jgi:5-methylcytosine-specific restriction endonuclease McrA
VVAPNAARKLLCEALEDMYGTLSSEVDARRVTKSKTTHRVDMTRDIVTEQKVVPAVRELRKTLMDTVRHFVMLKRHRALTPSEETQAVFLSLHIPDELPTDATLKTASDTTPWLMPVHRPSDYEKLYFEAPGSAENSSGHSYLSRRFDYIVMRGRKSASGLAARTVIPLSRTATLFLDDLLRHRRTGSGNEDDYIVHQQTGAPISLWRKDRITAPMLFRHAIKRAFAHTTILTSAKPVESVSEFRKHVSALAWALLQANLWKLSMLEAFCQRQDHTVVTMLRDYAQYGDSKVVSHILTREKELARSLHTATSTEEK